MTYFKKIKDLVCLNNWMKSFSVGFASCEVGSSLPGHGTRPAVGGGASPTEPEPLPYVGGVSPNDPRTPYEAHTPSGSKAPSRGTVQGSSRTGTSALSGVEDHRPLWPPASSSRGVRRGW